MELTALFAVACIQVSFSRLAFAHMPPNSPSKFNCWCNCGEDVAPRREHECTVAPEEVVEVVEDVPELVEEVEEEIAEEEAKEEEAKGEEAKEEEAVTEEETIEEAMDGSTAQPTASYDAGQGLFLRKLSKPGRCVCKHRRTCVCCSCCERYVEEPTDYEVDYEGGHDYDCGEDRHHSNHLGGHCTKERFRYRLRPMIYLGYGFDYLLHPPMAYRHIRPCCHLKTHRR